MQKLVLLGILVAAQANASLYSKKITGTDGSPRCCSKNYSACESGCSQDSVCLEDCQKKHCLKDASRCENSPQTTTGEAPKLRVPLPTGKMGLRFDGKLTGPGVVTFDAENHAAGDT